MSSNTGKSADKSKSLSDFRAAHDKNFIIPNKIREALRKLGDGWEYEVDFVRLAGISTIDLANFRDHFESHIVVASGNNRSPKRVWFGSEKIAAEARKMV